MSIEYFVEHYVVKEILKEKGEGTLLSGNWQLLDMTWAELAEALVEDYDWLSIPQHIRPYIDYDKLSKLIPEEFPGEFLRVNGKDFQGFIEFK